MADVPVNGPRELRTDLTGKVTLVTGGTAGIGRAAVLAMARNGADVGILARDPAPALELVEEIEALGRRGLVLPADLTSYDEVRTAVEMTVEEFGKLDILVGSGGAGLHTPARPFHEIDPSYYLNYVQTHIFTRLHAVRAALDVMVPARSGSIVLLTTDAGRTPTPGESLIGGAAAALIFMVRALGRELARHHVRINAVAITLTRDTPGYDWYASQGDSDNVLVRAFKKLEREAPFGLNSPEDVVNAISFLASDASAQMSGVTMSVNGGVSFPG
ncbi:MAG: SDR family oxidoreductase [Chloroflexi bacterium]|nr:SDR family oxidoreductase [Chloroflexota bacterium]